MLKYRYMDSPTVSIISLWGIDHLYVRIHGYGYKVIHKSSVRKI